MRDLYRPGHADYTYEARFGQRDHRGGGRASARETVARVAAAAVARQFLEARYGIEVVGWVDAIGDISAQIEPSTLSRKDVEASLVRCPDPARSDNMVELIEAIQAEGDTVGGTLEHVCGGAAGAPVFDRLEADSRHAIPACLQAEIGSGFGGTTMRGSEHNDSFEMRDGQLFRSQIVRAASSEGYNRCSSLRALRIQAVSTHFKAQQTVNQAGDAVTFRMKVAMTLRLTESSATAEAAFLLTLLTMPSRYPRSTADEASRPKAHEGVLARFVLTQTRPGLE